MRTRSTFGVALLLGCFSLVVVTSPALASSKKKKAAAAAPAPAAEPAKDKSVDDMMQESSTTKKSAASSESSGGGSKDEEPVGEPDAWEKPPQDAEKPKPVEAPKVEPKVGDGRRIEVGLTPGYGFKVGDADWSTLNPYGLAIGIRGGMTFSERLYLGVGFVYHIGESDVLINGVTGSPSSTSTNVKQNYMLAFAEAGYNVWLKQWILRPSIWVGMGFALVDPYLTSGVLRTVTDFMFAPGLNVIYTMGLWYLGVDARYVFVTGDGAKGLDLFGMVGMRFE
jgi:hypothetical protein